MFRWFEKRLDPFPPQEPVEPPRTLVAFCLHYTRGAWPYIAVSAVLTSVIALTEVWMFGFLGSIVDWLSVQNRETFLQTEGWRLAGMAVIVLIALPVTVFAHSLFNQQTLMGNYPMRIRWQVHRYLLKQSMSFYQDEFAGRIATKLMQTALAVRECVIKLIDVLNYVSSIFSACCSSSARPTGGSPRRLSSGWSATSCSCAISSRGSARWPSSRPMRAR